MSEVMIVGLLSLAGTLCGSIGGILTANKLTNYRIQALEERVKEHNQIKDRTIVLERDVKTAFNRIDENKSDIKAVVSKIEHIEDNCRNCNGRS